MILRLGCQQVMPEAPAAVANTFPPVKLAPVLCKDLVSFCWKMLEDVESVSSCTFLVTTDGTDWWQWVSCGFAEYSPPRRKQRLFSMFQQWRPYGTEGLARLLPYKWPTGVPAAQGVAVCRCWACSSSALGVMSAIVIIVPINCPCLWKCTLDLHYGTFQKLVNPMLENSKHWLLESASRADQWQVRNIGIEKAVLQSKKQHRNWKPFLFKFSHVLLNFLNQTSTTPVPAYAILPRACFALDGQKRRRLRLHSSVQRSHLRSSVVLVAVGFCTLSLFCSPAHAIMWHAGLQEIWYNTFQCETNVGNHG